jgi:hypothetical protein
MSANRYPSRPAYVWRVTITSADNTRMIHHAELEDEYEMISVCTEARSASLFTQIWIKPPIGEVYSWD